MNFSRSPRLGVCLLVTFALADRGRADVTLAPLFRDHAVLQSGRPLPVWGKADPGERVTVEFMHQRAASVADASGRWKVSIAALPPSSTPEKMIVSGKNSVTVSDILVGEVWLASGQSNMARALSGTLRAKEEIAAAHYPLIRHFNARNTTAEQPADTVEGTWQECTPETVADFSGVGFFFARDLFRNLGVPVGLIHSSWGGTPIESWISDAALRSTAVYPEIASRWRNDSAEFELRKKLHPHEQAIWKKEEDRAFAARALNPLPWPTPPIGPGTPYAPSRAYNGMIAPLRTYALRGVIWWQGESNAARAAGYGELFQTLIRSWRADWAQGDFPFYFVQLSNYHLGWDSSKRVWADLRGEQARALVLPQTAMAVTIDFGDPYEVHMANKQEAGRRLALLALSQVYGMPIVSTGPLFLAARREGAIVRVQFSGPDAKLVSHAETIRALELAGADGIFHPAAGQIEGDTLVVMSASVKTPTSIRYAWTNAPDADLFNSTGLPVAPFSREVR